MRYNKLPLSPMVKCNEAEGIGHMTVEQKELEQRIADWTSIDNKPPLKEIEILRLLNNSELYSKPMITNKALSTLYSMLAFYRLKKNFKDQQISTILLQKSEMIESLPVMSELKSIKRFFNFYAILNETKIPNWSIRETDFNPAKLKKLKELLEEVEQLLNKAVEDDQLDSINESDLTNLYNTINKELESLEEVIKDAIESIDNRKSDIPVQSLNQKVRNFNQLKSQFYDLLPDTFKTTENKSPLEQLDEMVGLKDVKKYIHQYYHYLKYQTQRKDLGFQMLDEPGIHMIITGNPGTGKTTIARLLASIYHELGILDTNNVTEVTRSHLVGSFMGQSEENLINYLNQSIDGVLFIDEAYSLKREGQTGNDYGQAVIDTLVTSMTSDEYADKLAVFLAGYPEEMRQFLWSNPGLRSRFPEQNHIVLPDFQMDELLQIAEQTALDNDYFFTLEALNKFEGLIENARVDDSFGNARTIRDLVLKAIFKKGANKSITSNETWLEHMRIDVDDLDFIDDQVKEEQPMKRLEQLVGLTNIKQEVKKLSSFVRIQQQRRKQGFPPVPVQLHAVFSGNPGTGKTTVAKIYSQILKECGLLKRGHFVLASRSDLVAGYVGQTAIKTKQKVREALGGVLFIDEAYSLYRGEKDFGKEAIDTLVDEMTKHNENLVVILAGYHSEMERFIDSNPGLESRFKKYFDFEDYNQQELISITKFQTDLYQYELNDQALGFLKEQFNSHKIEGNARFVVNLIDEAIQFQALRMVEHQDNDIVHSFHQLTKQDIQKAWKTIRGSNK